MICYFLGNKYVVIGIIMNSLLQFLIKISYYLWILYCTSGVLKVSPFHSYSETIFGISEGTVFGVDFFS